MRSRRIKNSQNIKRTLTRLTNFLRLLVTSELNPLYSSLSERVRLSRRLLGSLLFIFGLIIFLSPMIYKKYIALKSEEARRREESEVSQTTFSSGEMVGAGPVRLDKSTLTKNFSLADLPKRILVPSCQIDLPIKPARVVDGEWELSQDSASFGLGSATPGSPGNTVIFAHAKGKLFGPLKGIKKEARVYLLTSSKWYAYEVVEVKTVLPSQTELIKPTEDDTLTLFTCTGFADAKRLIVIAKTTKTPAR